MRSQRIFILFLLCFIYPVTIPFLYSQENQVDIEELKKKAPKVFLDCPSCDSNYIRTEITFVNYVRDRKEADVHISGYYAAVHDQLSLVKGGATLEEILLQRTELATNYSYFASIGFSYTFGSVFSNVVNPRFGR